MQASSTSVATVPVATYAGRGTFYWLVITSGFLIGIGIALHTALAIANAVYPAYSPAPPLLDYPSLFKISAIGEFVVAIGALLGSFGLARALQASTPATDPAAGTRVFRAVLAGGAVVALGVLIQAASDTTSFVGVSFSYSGYYALLSAASLVAAIGFVVVFLGIAFALGARTTRG